MRAKKKNAVPHALNWNHSQENTIKVFSKT